MEFNQKYAGKWFKLTGDVNALEYGATYIRAIDRETFETKVFSGRDWYGYENDGKKYYCADYSGTLAEAIECLPETASYVGLDLNDYTMTQAIDAYVAYGKGFDENSQDTSAKRLLGFNPDDRAYIPSDYIV